GMEIRGSNIVITGASSGIGRATALELARRGANLVLAARREPHLAEVADECRRSGVRCAAVPTDVANREACHHLIQRASEELGSVDALVNNAGFAVFDRAEEARPEDLIEMMETNYMGAVQCTQAVLPQMLERKRGSIVNVGSISGIMGYAGMGGYCATKFALAGFTEALRDEVISRGVDVSLICPGTTDTPFFITAEKGKMPSASRLVLAISPERVAAAIAAAIESPSYRKVLPLIPSLFMKFKECCPRTAHFLMRRVSASLLRGER
ncbi:MAG TPA: SDR family oxidoreductase, partial [Thermoanaerobaculia bacterium]|nr:SDR family oxidoreductase [Thermoanaerobaculia bacterium]